MLRADFHPQGHDCGIVPTMDYRCMERGSREKRVLGGIAVAICGSSLFHIFIAEAEDMSHFMRKNHLSRCAHGSSSGQARQAILGGAALARFGFEFNRRPDALRDHGIQS